MALRSRRDHHGLGPRQTWWRHDESARVRRCAHRVPGISEARVRGIVADDAIGGRLPEWDDLRRQTEWARERGIATHLDGARIWESAPYYDRPHADIAALFDTVYVSLYKALCGFAGCLVAGPEDFVDELRVWRHRHGGTLWNLFPLAASAQRGLDELVPQMPRFLEHARALALALRELPGVSVVPDPPQTASFFYAPARPRPTSI